MTKINKKIIVVVILLSVTTLSSILILNNINSKKIQKTIITSDSLIKINKNQLIGATDVAVTGTVKDIKSFTRESKSLPGEKEVYSNITFEVESYLYNPKKLTLKDITIQVIGGETPELKMFSVEEKPLEINHKYAIFLKQGDGDLFLISAAPQGMFEINNDGRLGVGESQKNMILNIFNQDLTIEKLKTELSTAKPEPLPGQKN